MRRESDRLGSLAAAVSKAAPDFDGEQQRIALEAYRRLAEGSPAHVSSITRDSGATSERVEELLASWSVSSSIRIAASLGCGG